MAEAGTRGLSVTAGVWFVGNTEIDTITHSTGSGYTFSSYYYNGSAWVETTGVSQISNLQRNDVASGLVTIGNNKWVNAWIYLCPQGDLYWVYGQAEYNTLAEAQATMAPSLVPNYISSNTRLISRITLQKSATNFGAVSNISNTSFTSGTATNHNNLAGLQGGTLSEYYHLTNTAYNNLYLQNQPVTSTSRPLLS